MYVISCAFRWGVAIVGEFFYWALLTVLWDPLLGTEGVLGVSSHEEYHLGGDEEYHEEYHLTGLWA